MQFCLITLVIPLAILISTIPVDALAVSWNRSIFAGDGADRVAKLAYMFIGNREAVPIMNYAIDHTKRPILGHLVNDGKRQPYFGAERKGGLGLWTEGDMPMLRESIWQRVPEIIFRVSLVSKIAIQIDRILHVLSWSITAVSENDVEMPLKWQVLGDLKCFGGHEWSLNSNVRLAREKGGRG